MFSVCYIKSKFVMRG